MWKLSCYPLSSRDKLIRWGILGFSCTPLLGAYFYNQGYRIAFLVCPFRHFIGIPCPTCGMTRSFMSIVQGDLSQAVSENLFGPVLFSSFLVTAIHITIELLTKRRITTFYCQILWHKKFHLLAVFTALSYHALRLYHLSQTGELYFSFIHSPLGNFFLTILSSY